jgi:anti-sigma regulatory factor (Ser/Thr protein kinase)
MFSSVIAIEDPSRISEGRRVATQLALESGLDQLQTANVALIATEAGTNLWKHAGSGELHLVRLDSHGMAGLDILAIDRGPGMADLDRCLRDGFSTAGTAGTGLGAIQRLSSEFDVFTLPGLGTVIFSRLKNGVSKEKIAGEIQVGALLKPMRHEIVCGDAWYMEPTPQGVRVLVADGLGHGPGAAEASWEAVTAFRRVKDSSPLRMLETIHVALRGTRGAAIGVACLDYQRGVAEFAGLGNISASLVTPVRTQQMISHNGTAGHEGRRVQMFTYPLEPEALLVMHSDGMRTGWNLSKYPRLFGHHPAVIAGVLYRDATRDRDDVCVVVVRKSL